MLPELDGGIATFTKTAQVYLTRRGIALILLVDKVTDELRTFRLGLPASVLLSVTRRDIQRDHICTNDGLMANRDRKPIWLRRKYELMVLKKL